jgi:anthranilate phosphoribosyltransferase
MMDALKPILNKVVQGQHLTRDEARQALLTIMEGEATPAQIGALLTALRMKGETHDELTGFAEGMRMKANRVETLQDNLLDTCGTGGDGGNTFNISTAAAIVVAAAGVRVAKHGNRAMSSKSGSADVLEALGVNIQLTAEQAKQCLEQVGICFMFAQTFHQSMKHVAVPRRELGFRTIFNLLGPLTNPAGADRQLMGVFDKSRAPLVAETMRELGLKRALVVASEDGLDEISVCAPTSITELKNGVISTYTFDLASVGITPFTMEELKGGNANENAAIIRSIFSGEQGARKAIVALNAGAALYVAEKADSLVEGLALANSVIDSGAALEKLQALVSCTEELAK